jgi:competence protein ComFC
MLKYPLSIAYMGFLDTIFSVIFPERCLGCGESGTAFCAKCVRNCPAALRESAAWIFPVYDYRHPLIKRSLWLFKYKGKRGLAQIFAPAIYEKMQEELSELVPMENFHDPMLVPVPLSASRRRLRGYNQSELLCLELLKINSLRRGVDLAFARNILVKPKDTEHQARIKDKRARLQNMRGTFALRDADAVRGRNIILVDDILTTGATLSEARRVLRSGGARKVIAFTVAH